MQAPIQFVPKASPFIQQRWGGLVIVIDIALLFFTFEMREIKWGILVAVVFTIAATLRNKWAYRLTIFPATKTLEYVYINIWGIKKTVTVDLTTADGSYKYEVFNKNSAGWRLLLYNKHYFQNRVSIRQNDKAGFSKIQLNEIAVLVGRYRKSER